jgi:hypothetical protein
MELQSFQFCSELIASSFSSKAKFETAILHSWLKWPKVINFRIVCGVKLSLIVNNVLPDVLLDKIQLVGTVDKGAMHSELPHLIISGTVNFRIANMLQSSSS